MHHAGKSGDQRGASRREDLLDTSIKLEKPKPEKDDEDMPMPAREGAYFIAEFVKTRGLMPNPAQIDLSLAPDESGVLAWYINRSSAASTKDKTSRAIYVDQPASQNALADLRNVSKGAISQQCKSLREAGYLDGDLQVTDEGIRRLLHFWPEVEAERQRQQDLPI